MGRAEETKMDAAETLVLLKYSKSQNARRDSDCAQDAVMATPECQRTSTRAISPPAPTTISFARGLTVLGPSSPKGAASPPLREIPKRPSGIIIKSGRHYSGSMETGTPACRVEPAYPDGNGPRYVEDIVANGHRDFERSFWATRSETEEDPAFSDAGQSEGHSTGCASPRSTESESSRDAAGRKRCPSRSLFKKLKKDLTLTETVRLLSRRHQDNYFIGWPRDKVCELPVDEQPVLFPVTPELKREMISKSVVTENKKLWFAFTSQEAWGAGFRRRLQDDKFKTLSDAKREASALWRQHCPTYDGSRAVRIRNDEGKIVMKRTRSDTESEFDYRQKLRRAKLTSFVDQLWEKRSTILDILKTEDLKSRLGEISDDIPEYVAPEDRLSQLTDVIAHGLRRELTTWQTEK